MKYPYWLPFIGFRTIMIDNDGMPSELECSRWESSCFMLEWFGYGVVLFTTEVKPRDN